MNELADTERRLEETATLLCTLRDRKAMVQRDIEDALADHRHLLARVEELRRREQRDSIGPVPASPRAVA